jgi:hypothetical protein
MATGRRTIEASREKQARAQRTFSWDEQLIFAKLSGDRNPIHLDPVAARRTAAGKPVVHGIHVLLWALEELAKTARPNPPSSVKADWTHFVQVGDRADLVLDQESETHLRLRVIVGNESVAKIVVGLSPNSPGSDSNPAALPAAAHLQAPADPPPAELPRLAGTIAPAAKASDVLKLFPHAAAAVGAHRLSGLMTLSYIVGMVCPGLNSVFSGIDVRFVQGGEATNVTYRVAEFDERFRLIRQSVAGSGIEGEIRAFVRVPPVMQPQVLELRSFVAPGEFRGISALVVGGSRGLGELTANALAAGGARVAITYNTGRADAERVADAIRAAGETCEALQYDVLDRGAVRCFEMLPFQPTHAFYFATGPIGKSRSKAFDAGLFDRFSEYYVKGFADFCSRLAAGAERGMVAFYPSSEYVESRSRPRGFAEYAMAKAAGEVLCEEINRSSGGIRIVCRRLPRLQTDQTAGFLPEELPAGSELILAAIRDTQKAATDTRIL